MKAEENMKEIRMFIQGKSQLVEYQNGATLLCLFEMRIRSELFRDKFSEGIHFPLELRLAVQKPHKFLEGNKYIQLF